MLGKNKEHGYALLESLVGLMLLSIVSLSLIVALPILLDENARLDHEQAIYHKLFELHRREIENDVVITDEFEAFRRGYEWCAVLEVGGWRLEVGRNSHRRERYERIICL